MTLERLKLKDFQRLRLFEVELDPLVTCLVGPSGSGKSAVLRGLRWIVLNRPSGDAFIRHGKKASRGELTVDGKRIVRKKGKGENKYALESVDQEGGRKGNNEVVGCPEAGEETDRLGDNRGLLDRGPGHGTYRAFGNDPPQAIQKILDVSEDSWQRQLDSPFWFCLTPGQVAKEINRIVDLEVIDRTLGKLAAGSRRAKAELEVGRQRYLDAKAKRKGLAWVERMDVDLRGVEEAEKVYEGIQSRRASLAESIEGVSRVVQDRDRLTDAKRYAVGANQAGDAWHALSRKTEGLREDLVKLGKIGELRCQNEKDLEAARKRTSQWKACPVCGQKIKP